MDAVARMSAIWNIPIIGYMAASNSLSDKKAYPTLARVSIRTTSSLAEATTALLRHYGWNKVAIVTNLGGLAYDRTVAFEEVFHARQIRVVKKVHSFLDDGKEMGRRKLKGIHFQPAHLDERVGSAI
ncbi:unnamed protein product [Haemonchus placei]|uniref:ANF_receptor domain-containing protein n=1 Tax=Haemonchus placei TaxID=6290 RepID=A0A0N4VW77_HAEPC|nr:unnamed protein product [Haemonchus placei]